MRWNSLCPEGGNALPQIIAQDSALSSVAIRVTQEGERVRLRVGDREVAVVSLEDLAFLEDVKRSRQADGL